MFEFIVTVFLCGDIHDPATCSVVGQKTAVYSSAEQCVAEEVEGVAASVSRQVLRNGGTAEEVIDLLEPLVVLCHDPKPVPSI